MKNEKNYFIGLDIGTDSVGAAVTDERYRLIKCKGEPMWCSHLFDAASQSADRRSFRTARRRLDRRQQRVRMADEIFAPEVSKIDANYYIRKQESALYEEDKTIPYEPKSYGDMYPTIHHLLCDLMNDADTKFDIRLINEAVDWLVAHRGHFLYDISMEHADRVLAFDTVYEDFLAWFEENDLDYPWDAIDVEKLGEIMKRKSGVNRKKTELAELFYDGKIPPADEYPLDKKELVAFLAGGKVKCKKLFRDDVFEDDLSMTISEDMEVLLPQLGDYADFVAKMAAMYDWGILSDILAGHTYISEAKVAIYEQHKQDLSRLKLFVKKYAPEQYATIFRTSKKDLANYVAYSYHLKSASGELPKGKATREDFYTFLKKTLPLDKMEYSDEDAPFVEDMRLRMENGTFLPKQVNSDNRVIPYQLYYIELLKVLENASRHYPFLKEADADGYTNIEKLKSIFVFRIPYFVGPLRTDNTKNGWMVRKSGTSGRIYPWNFESLVDFDASESAFINRMTNTCTYLPDECVLPKWSLLYTKFMVLNEINNLKVNGNAISVEAKQGIFNELFFRRSRVSVKQIREFLLANGYMRTNDLMSGLDESVKSSLKPFYEFRNLLKKNVLTEMDVEELIERSTYTEDRTRYKKWIRERFPSLSDEDFQYIAKLKYKDFGRFSKKFLRGLTGVQKETGEVGTILYFLWETNDNLMQILSDRYTFMEEIQRINADYYAENPMSMTQRMDEMGLSNAVKRPVTRTLAVVKDITQTMGCAPAKIFVEMARGADEKKQRTVTRKDRILDLYKQAKADTSALKKELEEMGDAANNRLQSEALFLYYLQLGKCMYSGEPIDVSLLASGKYNVDHIYPQSLVKDDSLQNNKVLVLSELNAKKGDGLVPKEIRDRMRPLWQEMQSKGLMTKEKYTRLVRGTPFSEEEKLGFINRQLVETRQSMKAVTQLLQMYYPETEIVYVKARLAADFKQEFTLTPKCRIINDLHHAKDAYLNIVVGNVYHERFTKKWFSVQDEYSLKTKALFTHFVKHGDTVVWNPDTDLPLVKKTYEKNNVHLTRYAFCQKRGQSGGLFNQMPEKKGENLERRKKDLDPIKYGGYNNATAAFFVIARYLRGKNTEVSFVPVKLMVKERFLSDDVFALDYVKRFLEGIHSKAISNVEFPIGKRVIKYKTVLSLDGYLVWVNGKTSGGRQLLLTSAESVIYSTDMVAYIKKIENYANKKKDNRNLLHDEDHDGLSEQKNILLYDCITDKLTNRHFQKMPGNQVETLQTGRNIFINLDFDTQIQQLLSCVDLLKSGRTGGCNLKAIGGSPASGVVNMGANLSSCKYTDVRIVDMSPAGLHQKMSCNLKDLLK